MPPCRFCNATFCANGGNCYEGFAAKSGSCSCMYGFTGERCEISLNPCQKCENNAKCKIVDGHVNCTCVDGYIGKFCEQKYFLSCKDKTACSNHGDCIQNQITNKTKCICDDGWYGDKCESAEQQPKSKRNFSASKIASIVLAILLFIAVIVLVVSLRKQRFLYSKFYNDDQHELENDF